MKKYTLQYWKTLAESKGAIIEELRKNRDLILRERNMWFDSSQAAQKRADANAKDLSRSIAEKDMAQFNEKKAVDELKQQEEISTKYMKGMEAAEKEIEIIREKLEEVITPFHWHPGCFKSGPWNEIKAALKKKTQEQAKPKWNWLMIFLCIVSFFWGTLLGSVLFSSHPKPVQETQEHTYGAWAANFPNYHYGGIMYDGQDYILRSLFDEARNDYIKLLAVDRQKDETIKMCKKVEQRHAAIEGGR